MAKKNKKKKVVEKQAKNKEKKIKTAVAAIFFIIVILLAGFYWREINSPFSSTNKENNVEFSVSKGESMSEIAKNLKTKGLIKSEFLFKTAVAIGGVSGKMKAGDYLLSPSLSILNIIGKLVRGESDLNKFSVIEGWTLKDIGEEAEKKGFFKKDDFLSLSGWADKGADKKIIDKYWFLKGNKRISLEGYIFPDTYRLEKKSDPRIFIEKALNNFGKKITPLLPEIKKSGRSLRDIIIMASMLEKEVKGYKEKQIAAGILWKRIRSGWPLQVDATANYVVGKKGKVTRKDLSIDSPYNSYQNFGLPPGPICNPGIESIKAAIFYKESSYWFYINTDDGKTIFSRTLEEHNMNRRKYLK